MQDISEWPQEVLLAFFKNADLSCIGTCARVCKRWFQMSNDNELWRQKCIESFSHLPTNEDCKLNWLIPVRKGDNRKNWPHVIECLQDALAHETIAKKDEHNSKNSKCAIVQKLIDEVSSKEWITITDFKRIADVVCRYVARRRGAYRFSFDSTTLDPESVDRAIEFFLEMDLVMISQSTASRIKHTGIGIKFIENACSRSKQAESGSISLLWSILEYARQYSQFINVKGLPGGVKVLLQVIDALINSEVGAKEHQRSRDVSVDRKRRSRSKSRSVERRRSRSRSVKQSRSRSRLRSRSVEQSRSRSKSRSIEQSRSRSRSVEQSRLRSRSRSRSRSVEQNRSRSQIGRKPRSRSRDGTRMHSRERANIDPRRSILAPHLIDVVINTINTYNFEAALVFDAQIRHKVQEVIRGLYYYIGMMRPDTMTEMDMLIVGLKTIFPPKTSHEALTLIFFKNALQKLENFEEHNKLSDWWSKLPFPMITGSTTDKILILHRLEVLNSLDCNSYDKTEACSFLLDPLLNVEEKWTTKVMNVLLKTDNKNRSLLTVEQQQILFAKLKTMASQSIIAKDQVNKWIFQLAIISQKINEHKELVVSIISTDPATILNKARDLNPELFQLVLEEYQRDPKDTTETLLLIFGAEMANADENKVPKEKLPYNIISLLITIIGKRLAQRRAANDPNEDVEYQPMHMLNYQEDSDELIGDEFPEDEIELAVDPVNEENVPKNGLEWIEPDNHPSLVNSECMTAQHFVLTLAMSIKGTTEENIEQLIPRILDLLKTEYNNPKVSTVYASLLFILRRPYQSKLTEVADAVAVSFVEWICQTNNLNYKARSAEPEILYYQMLKDLLEKTSKNFLTADLVIKLTAWITTEMQSGASSEYIELLGLLAGNATDPKEPTEFLLQWFDGEDFPELAISYITSLLSSGAFKNPQLKPLLERTWQLKCYPHGTCFEVTPVTKCRFIGKAAQFCPLFVLDHMEDVLNFFENSDIGDQGMARLYYGQVIKLIDDPLKWVHHMKILLQSVDIDYCLKHEWISHEEDVNIECILEDVLPVLQELLAPSHPHYQKLCADLKTEQLVQKTSYVTQELLLRKL